MDTLEWILVIAAVVVVAILIFAIITHEHQDSELGKTKRQFRKFLKKIGVKHPGRTLNSMSNLIKISLKEPKDQIDTMNRIMKCYSSSGKFLMDADNGLDVALAVSKSKSPDDSFTVPVEDFDMFFRAYRFILEADETFEISNMITAYKTCKRKEFLNIEGLLNIVVMDDQYESTIKEKLRDLVKIDDKLESAKRKELLDFVETKSVFEVLANNDVRDMLKRHDFFGTTYKEDVLESFARAWVDQKNADLGIDFDTAMKFVSKGRDFALFVNLDILAKRSDIELDEKNLIMEVDDEGLKAIIHSLIRAKYEGVYMSESESLSINKANVVEYADSFKVTVDLLKKLYRMKRDVKRFTDVMIRAHNAGININFSMTDLYSMTDEQFDILVTNIIKASNKGISIDQNDLIRQNIRNNDVTQLVKALIKANEYNLDLTPDELMNYIASTHSDVVKFVKAYHYALEHKLPSEDGTPLSKDHLVEYSHPDRDLYDYVQGLKYAKDVEKKCIEDFSNNLRLAREEGHLTEEQISELKPSSFDRGINYENLKKHFIKFGSVMPVIEAIKLADKNDLALDFKLGTQICESADWDLKSAMNWAKTPLVDEVVPSIVCVTKEGIQITPKISATIRGKLPLLFAGYGKDILFKRINEATTMELESAEKLDVILKTLPEISHRVLHRVNEEEKRQEIKTGRVKEMELNNVCCYDLLDINIYDISVGQNVKAELNLRQAQIEADIRRMQAEADRAKAEADLRRAMVEQYEKGIKPNFNELHKANLLADNGKDINTGYETPE